MDEELTTQQVVPETKASTAGTQVPPPDPPPPRTIAVTDGESWEIPDIGDAAVQAAFEKMLDEATPKERGDLLDTFDVAEEFGEQEAFEQAVLRGKDAVGALMESLDFDGTEGRRLVRDVLEYISDWAEEKGTDPRHTYDRLLRHSGLIHDEPETLLRLLSARHGAEVVATILNHEDEFRGLLEDPPDPDTMLREGVLNDKPDAVWLDVGRLIDILLDYWREIDFVTDDTVPAVAKEALYALDAFESELIPQPAALGDLGGQFVSAMTTTSKAKRDKLLHGIVSALRGTLDKWNKKRDDTLRPRGAAALAAVQAMIEAAATTRSTGSSRSRGSTCARRRR